MIKAIPMPMPDAHPGAIVALIFSPDQQQQLRDLTLPEAEADHLTLMLLAYESDQLFLHKNHIVQTLAAIASSTPPLEGVVGGLARFTASAGDDQQDTLVALFDCPDLPDLAADLTSELRGIETPGTHGFLPHITLMSLPPGAPAPLESVPRLPLRFDSLSLIWAGERMDLPLLGASDEIGDDPDLLAWLEDDPDELRGNGFKSDFGARVGQAIAGRLIRGQGGRFASSGSAPATAKKPEAPSALPGVADAMQGREADSTASEKEKGKPKGKDGKAPKEKKPVIDKAKQAEERQNAVFDKLQIDTAGRDALRALAQGDQPNAGDATGFLSTGLVEQAADGNFRLTPLGRAMLRAATRGDAGAAGAVISLGRDRMAQRAEREKKRQAKKPVVPEVQADLSRLAIKADTGRGDEWVLNVLGNPYGGPQGGKDSHGEFFSPQTKFHEDKYGLPPAVYYHGYDPATGKPMGDPEYIGHTVGRQAKDDGVWYRVLLDKANPYAKKVWQAAQLRKAVASTGTIGHLRRVEPTGHIRQWAVGELSLWDWDGSQRSRPANTYAVAIPALKSLYQRAGITFLAPEEAGDASELSFNHLRTYTEEFPMTPEELQAQIAAGVKAALEEQRQADADAAKAKQELQQRIDAAVKAARTQWDADAAKANRLPGGWDEGQAPTQRRFADTAKFDGLSAEDTAFLIGVVNATGQHASAAAYKAAYIKLAEGKDANAGEVQHAMKMAGVNPADFLDAAKANELMHTTQAGAGDEWVGLTYSNRLWQVVRDPVRIVSMIPEIIIPQGSEGVYDPLEGADPIFYRVAETTGLDATTGRPNATVPASKPGTDRVLHTATKIGGRVVWSGEMEETSLIPMMSGDGGLRAKMEVASAEALEHAVIDGDAALAATTNINLISGTPTTQVYTAFDGVRKLALITNAANSRSAGGALADTDFLETLKLMGAAGLLGADMQKTILLIDPNVRWKVLTITSIKTRDVFLNATIENGEFAGIWGYKVYTSYQMHKASAKRMANAAGKVDATEANNTTGAILGVRPDQWKLARKRRATIETSRWIESDANQIVVMLSAGLKPRDTEAAAITYNVGVA